MKKSSILISLLSTFLVCGCVMNNGKPMEKDEEDSPRIVEETKTKLDAPSSFRFNSETKIFRWDKVENATGYVFNVGGVDLPDPTHLFDTNPDVDMYDASDGDFFGTLDIKIKALGDETIYLDSDYSNTINCVFGEKIPVEATKLATPTNFAFDESKKLFTWTEVENASSYKIDIGGEIKTTSSHVYDASQDGFLLTKQAKVMAIGDGKYFSDSDYSAEIDAKFSNPIATINGITLTLDTVNVTAFGEQQGVTATITVTGEGDYNKTMKVESDNPNIARPSKGLISSGEEFFIEGVKKGNTSIKVSSVGNTSIEKTITVNVGEEVKEEYITIYDSEVTIDQYSSTLIGGEYSSIPTYLFSTNGIVSINEINSNGISITATSPGETTITFVVGSGLNAKVGQCHVVVNASSSNKQLYYVNNYAWSDIYLYSFGEGNKENASWPGVKLSDTIKDDAGHDVYPFTLDILNYTSFIISGNDGTYGKAQTKDIAYSSLGKKNAIEFDGWINQDAGAGTLIVNVKATDYIPPQVKSITLDKQSLSLYAGVGEASVTATVNGTSGCDQQLLVSCTPAGSLTINKEEITSGESVTISASSVVDGVQLVFTSKSNSAIKTICEIDIAEAPSQFVKFEDSSLKILGNNSSSIGVITSDSDVTYTNNDPTIFNISNESKDGLTVTGLKDGRGTITAQNTNTGETATLTVFIQSQVDIYVTNNLSWTNIYVVGTTNSIEQEPVSSISNYLNENDESVYKFTLLTYEYDSFVFTNGLTDGDRKSTISIDYAGIKTNDAWWIKNEIDQSGNFKLGSWTYSPTRTIYFKPGSDLWAIDSAKFWAYTWHEGTNPIHEDSAWATVVTNGVYKFTIPSDMNRIIFVRVANTCSEFKWPNGVDSWNQTDNITIDFSMNCVSITGWESSNYAWSNYQP